MSISLEEADDILAGGCILLSVLASNLGLTKMENVVCDRLTGARSSTIARIWCAMFLYIMVTRIVGVDGLTKRSRPTDAIDRLSKVFGISKIPARIFHRSPPQYMTELYNSITETGGLTTKAGPYNADVVRSFPDKGRSNYLSSNDIYKLIFY